MAKSKNQTGTKAKAPTKVAAEDGASARTAGAGSQGAAQDSPQLDPEVAARIAGLRAHVRESFGKVAMSMMMLPRYRQQTIADLQHLVLEPLIRDRVAIAQRAGENAAAQDIAGVAIWASLSDEAEGRLRDQIASGTWPVRLKAEDWNSGQNNWLIDVIAPDQKSTASVIANFRQVVKEGSLKLHPLITRLIDEETLKSMGAHKGSGTAPVPEKVPEGETVN